MNHSNSTDPTLVAIAAMGLSATLVAILINPAAGVIVVSALRAIAACAKALTRSGPAPGPR